MYLHYLRKCLSFIVLGKTLAKLKKPKQIDYKFI